MIDNDKQKEIQELFDEEPVDEILQDSPEVESQQNSRKRTFEENIKTEILEDEPFSDEHNSLDEETELTKENNEEQTKFLFVEDNSARVMTIEQEELPQYEEVHTKEIVEQNETIEVLPSEKKSILSNIINKKDHYIDYKTRLIGYSLVCIALFVITIIFLQGAFTPTTSQTINYNETSNLDYKVYLKPNKFYDTDYLGKNKVYIANLIDNIEINYRYNYNIEQPTNVNFNYSIVAKLTIADGSTKNNYFEKEYVLLSNKVKSIKNGMNFILNEKVSIDYAYYNSLANNFRQQFGLDTTSNLTVYLKVNKNTDIENATNPVENSTMFVKIPLSEKAINIELNYQDINNSNYIIQSNDSKTDNIIFGVCAAISLLATLIFSIQCIRLLTMLRGKKTIYDKYVEKILNEYDRLIVENGTGPDTENNRVIKISNFEELLDVRDNLKLPIMYYVVTKHTKSYFYIKHNDDLYLMVLKAVDLENAKEKNK